MLRNLTISIALAIAAFAASAAPSAAPSADVAVPAVRALMPEDGSWTGCVDCPANCDGCQPKPPMR